MRRDLEREFSDLMTAARACVRMGRDAFDADGLESDLRELANAYPRRSLALREALGWLQELTDV